MYGAVSPHRVSSSTSPTPVVFILLIPLFGKLHIWCSCLKFYLWTLFCSHHTSMQILSFSSPVRFSGARSSKRGQYFCCQLHTQSNTPSFTNQNISENKNLMTLEALCAGNRCPSSVFTLRVCAEKHRHIFVANLTQKCESVTSFCNSQTVSSHFPTLNSLFPNSLFFLNFSFSCIIFIFVSLLGSFLE